MSRDAISKMDDDRAYDAYIECMRETEYPMLKGRKLSQKYELC